MTETEKKGVDYINKRIAEGQTNISEMIAELLEQIDTLKCCGNCKHKDCGMIPSKFICDKWESK